MPKTLDVAKEVEELDMAIQEERRFAIQAALVRKMKTEKEMKVTALVPEVCKELSSLFQAHPPFVRKQLEELIDLEYMQRCEDNPQLLRYIA